MTSTPTLSEAVGDLIDLYLDDVNVSLPAKILEYDATTQKATVQPLIKRGHVDPEGRRAVRQRPAIANVPVIFPGGGGARLTFPIAAGDKVMLVFSHASLDKWLNDGREVDPLDDRRHAVSDAVAFPGLYDFKSAPAADPDATVLTDNDIRLGSSAASDPVALKSDLDALKTYIDTHIHTGVTTGAGTSGAPASPSPTPTGATKVKAE